MFRGTGGSGEKVEVKKSGKSKGKKPDPSEDMNDEACETTSTARYVRAGRV